MNRSMGFDPAGDRPADTPGGSPGVRSGPVPGTWGDPGIRATTLPVSSGSTGLPAEGPGPLGGVYGIPGGSGGSDEVPREPAAGPLAAAGGRGGSSNGSEATAGPVPGTPAGGGAGPGAPIEPAGAEGVCFAVRGFTVCLGSGFFLSRAGFCWGTGLEAVGGLVTSGVGATGAPTTSGACGGAGKVTGLWKGKGGVCVRVAPGPPGGVEEASECPGDGSGWLSPDLLGPA